MGAFTASARTERVLIEQRFVTTNGANEEIESWSSPRKAYASVRFGSGGERREAARLGEAQSATFGLPATLANRAIKTTDRLRYAGAVWDIKSAVTEPRRTGVVVTATRGGKDPE